jgi:allantoinase
VANEFSIASRRVVTPAGVGPGVVRVREGRIDAVEPKVGGAGTLDVGDLVVMPGIVDTHVHVNEPGRTEWEGFRSAGRAAAAGGTTTIVVMPLNCTPAATTVAALRAEAGAALGTSLVDFGLWGGVVPGNAGEIEGMWGAGALGFKCFLVDSGADDFPRVGVGDLDEAMAETARLGAPLLAHSEDPGVIEAAGALSGLRDCPRSYAVYLASRPPEAERRAIETMIALCRRHRGPTHIVHVAAASALEDIARARAEGLPLTAETCPHYLSFAAEKIGDGRTVFKCAPPIRDAANRERLWAGLREGVLGMVASDHSPCPPELKRMGSGDFGAAWGGVSSLQLSLPVVWTGAARRGHSLGDLARWLCEGPARLAGIDDSKGRIAPGYDADLVVWDPDAAWTVRAGDLHHRHAVTPYDGVTLRGRVKATFVRGTRVYADAGFGSFGLGDDGFAREAGGEWVLRKKS